jgi:hypothetical protein
MASAYDWAVAPQQLTAGKYTLYQKPNEITHDDVRFGVVTRPSLSPRRRPGPIKTMLKIMV